MNNKNLSIKCPNCGTVYTASQGAQTTTYNHSNSKKMDAESKIKMLKDAGVDVSNLFSMKAITGQESIARLEGGQLYPVPEDDPVFSAILSQGTVPNNRLFRRWVMSQMFHMLAAKDFSGKPIGFLTMLQQKGYKYQWRMVIEELRVQAKLYSASDFENFMERNRWFHLDVVESMMANYLYNLKTHIFSLKKRRVAGKDCIMLRGRRIYLSDLNAVLQPLERIKKSLSSNPTILHMQCKEFFEVACSLWIDNATPQSERFKGAYKGAGAYFTMKNMILFHGCRMYGDNDYAMSQSSSLKKLEQLAEEYKTEGWRLFGVMKKLIADNNVDIEAKMAEWRNSKKH